MRKISILGVVIGSITDIVATSLFQIPLLAYITIRLTQQGIPAAQINGALLTTLHNNPLFYATSMLIGCLGSILGGYIAARIAKHDEVLNGALASILCVGSGLYALGSGHSSAPIWQELLAIPFSIALSALGGYLRLRQKYAQQAQA